MTTQTSSYPNVVDRLLTIFRALTAVTTLNATVYDGFSGMNVPETFVQVGGETEPAADGGQVWAALGAGGGYPSSVDELYTVNCYVFAFAGGSNDAGSTGASDAQKTARDNAFTIFHAIETAIRTDPGLAGTTGTRLLTSGWASVGQPHFRVEISDESDPDLSKGRKCRISFGVEIHNRLYT